MNRTEIYISDFRSAVQEKDRISDARTYDKWETVSYETAKCSGSMLYSVNESWPEPVTVEPELTGWYKIYVCMMHLGSSCFANHTDLKLTDDEFSSTISPHNTQPYVIWTYPEACEEAFWKIADMTGQKLTISKARDGFSRASNLLWVRFVPVTEEEGLAWETRFQDPATRTIHAHMDNEFMFFDVAKTPHDFCKPYYAMANSAVKYVTQEVVHGLMEYFDPDAAPASNAWDHTRYADAAEFAKNRAEIYPVQIEYAHRHGMQVLAGHRVSLSNFGFPGRSPAFHLPFVTENPHLCCKDRTGGDTGILSYAYPEVQDYMVDHILESARHGFDGVNLIYIRGMCVLFEEPVCQRFAEKYGTDIDLRRLPESDPRLTEIFADVMGEFLGKVRTALNNYAQENGKKPLKVFLTTHFTVADSKLVGIDIERFAKAGLIDGVIPSRYSVWEEVDDVLAEDGLIDLEKYKEKGETAFIVKRSMDDSIALMAEDLKNHRAIADKYGLELFTEISREGTAPEKCVSDAKLLYANGTDGISLWDCYPVRTCPLAEWDAVSRLNPENAAVMSTDRETYRTGHKVLSYAGHNMRFYHPSWRG